MSGRIAVVYTGDLSAVADAFAEAARQVATSVVVVQLGRPHPGEGLHHLEWADGIAFGTPADEHAPDAALMRFLASSESLWSSGRLDQKAVTVFTDEPERVAPDSILHPIYAALYRWGAIIVGPRDFDLSWVNRLDHLPTTGSSPLPAQRRRAAQYRARRLVGVASLLAEARSRQQALQL